MELEKWGDVSKIENCIKKLAKSIVEEEDLFIFKAQLLEEAETFIEVARYREGSIYLRLICQMDKDDIEIREYSKEIQEIVNLDIELTRAMKDRYLFPYVYLKVLDLYLQHYLTSEYYDMFLDDYPHDMMSEMEYMNEEIAHGILRIKKKYPKLFREYKEELTELFNKSTEGFNREQRRRLK